MKRTLLHLIAWLLPAVAGAQILPTPRSVQPTSGHFVVDGRTRIVADNTTREAADWLAALLGLEVADLPNPTGNNIALACDEKLPVEGYRLEITPQQITLVGGSHRGVVYAAESLLQLLPPEVYGRVPQEPIEVNCCRVEDAPAYGYRGVHLDIARTWLPKERIMRHIDLMAHHKLNTLHLHLTDDEGWRIEILSHPELATVGGFRGGDSPVMAIYGRHDQKYGGYLTQEEMRQIIRYAHLRGVEIIPEIDLPGHSRTIARLHPEILCDYTPDPEITGGYDVRSAWCVAREENYRLLEDIMGEICDLFPSTYIHIGGDEVEMSQWKRCPRCQQLMQREGMTRPEQLEDYFMSRLITFLESKNKKPVVWNEAIQGGGLNKEALVHGWQSVKACKESTAAGYRTVIMPGEYFYFDMRQSKHEPGHTWAAIIDVKRVYGFDPKAQGFTPEQIACIEGYEGTFWSELHVAHNPEDPDYLDFMTYPRLVAVAELGWHNGPKEPERFMQTLTTAHYPRMDAMGIRYHLEPPTILYRDGLLSATTRDGSTLFYTVEPDTTQHRYTGPIATAKPELYRFRSRLGRGRSGWEAHTSHYRTITPALQFSSSMSESTKSPFSRVAQYRAAWTSRTHRAGDWVLYRFDEPVTCREIFLQTGYAHLARAIVSQGYVEASYDGEHFERVGELVDGCCTLRPQSPVKALRITATADRNGCAMVIFQPPKIKP